MTRKKFDEHAFDGPLSREARYWLGMLMADGCVTTNNGLSHCLVFNLKFSDYDHVASFQRFMRGTGKIYINTTKQHTAMVRMTSRHMTDVLALYGIVPRKSLIAVAPDILKNDIDFWRGMVDGDGTVSFSSGIVKGKRYTYPYIKLCGSRSIVTQFRDFVNTIDLSISPSISSADSIYAASMTGTKAVRIIHALYNDAPIALPRKFSVAKTIIVTHGDGRIPLPFGMRNIESQEQS